MRLPPLTRTVALVLLLSAGLTPVAAHEGHEHDKVKDIVFIVVTDEDGNEVDRYPLPEVHVSPKHHATLKRWERDNIAVRIETDNDHVPIVEYSVEAWDVPANKISLNTSRVAETVDCQNFEKRDNTISICSMPGEDVGWFGQTQIFVKQATPHKIYAAKVWLATEGDDDLFQKEVATHEIGHALGLGHDARLNPDGYPISIMHPTIILGTGDIQPHDVSALETMDYRGGQNNRVILPDTMLDNSNQNDKDTKHDKRDKRGGKDRKRNRR